MKRKQVSRQSRQRLIRCDPLEQWPDVPHSLGRRQPELSRMTADRIGKLGAIADQPVAHPGQHEGCLLPRALHRHEAHRQPAHRLAQRLGIGRVALAALDIWLHILRREHLHLMPQ